MGGLCIWLEKDVNIVNKITINIKNSTKNKPYFLKNYCKITIDVIDFSQWNTC